MFTKIKINNYLIAFFIILIILEIIFLKHDFFTRSENIKKIDISISSDNIPYKNLHIIAERERWTKKIKNLGPENAYREFKKEFASFHFEQQHLIGHLFGELLFQQGGVTYLKYCDNNFGFACYHGFFTTAIGSEGASVVKELDRVCVETSGPGGSGCQHGLGHGLIEYYGHNLRGLKNSLKDCKDTTSFSKKFGCTSGAFMEFNIPIPMDREEFKIEKRIGDESKPHYPCTEIDEEFKESCYYELPQYWKNLYNTDTTKYTKIDTLCSKVENQVYKESCYLGMGHVLAPGSNYDIYVIKEVCQTMSTKEGLLLCLAGATWEVFTNKNSTSKVYELCKTLPASSYKECIIKADLIQNNGQLFLKM